MKNISKFFLRNAAILGQPFFFARTEERSSCTTIIFPDGTTSSSGCERTHKVDVYWAPSRHSHKVENAFVTFCDQNGLSGELNFSDGSTVVVFYELNEVHYWISLQTIREKWIEAHGDSPKSLQDLMEVEDYHMDNNWYPLNPA